MNKKVEFPGHGTFYFINMGDGTGPLAPLEHVDEYGDISMLAAFTGESYAHVIETGEIKRFGEVIGHKKDLIPVT